MGGGGTAANPYINMSSDIYMGGSVPDPESGEMDLARSRPGHLLLYNKYTPPSLSYALLPLYRSNIHIRQPLYTGVCCSSLWYCIFPINTPIHILYRHIDTGSAVDLSGLAASSKGGKSGANRDHNQVKIALSLYKVQQNIYLLDFQRVEGDAFGFMKLCALIITELKNLSAASRANPAAAPVAASAPASLPPVGTSGSHH